MLVFSKSGNLVSYKQVAELYVVGAGPNAGAENTLYCLMYSDYTIKILEKELGNYRLTGTMSIDLNSGKILTN
jgi:hypothetical protein